MNKQLKSAYFFSHKGTQRGTKKTEDRRRLKQPLIKSFWKSRNLFSKKVFGRRRQRHHAGAPYTRSWEFPMLKYHFKPKCVNVPVVVVKGKERMRMGNSKGTIKFYRLLPIRDKIWPSVVSERSSSSFSFRHKVLKEEKKSWK